MTITEEKNDIFEQATLEDWRFVLAKGVEAQEYNVIELWKLDMTILDAIYAQLNLKYLDSLREHPGCLVIKPGPSSGFELSKEEKMADSRSIQEKLMKNKMSVLRKILEYKIMTHNKKAEQEFFDGIHTTFNDMMRRL